MSKFGINVESPLFDGLMAVGGPGGKIFRRDTSGTCLRFLDKDSGESIPLVDHTGCAVTILTPSGVEQLADPSDVMLTSESAPPHRKPWPQET